MSGASDGRGWRAAVHGFVDATGEADALADKLGRKDALIGVIGLGYVGLPLSLAFAEGGARVLGFDTDGAKSEAVNRGETYLRHYRSERIANAVQAGRMSATSDMSRLSEPDVLMICVPTPLTRHSTPDLAEVKQTSEAIARCLRPGQLVILESTTYPGTTKEVVQPILEQSGLRSGVEYWLAFSPEREDPGNRDYSTASLPKVIGADDDSSHRLAQLAYAIFAETIVPVSSAATAEAVKITENVFRAVNIALINELKMIYSAMGIDVWEVIEAAKTKPFGFMPFYPGPGLGGHCVPIDPFYLAWRAREHGISAKFVELAGEINTAMPAYVIAELQRALNDRFAKGLNGARILVLGLAYKKNVDDLRESPALKLIEMLESQGAEVDFHDPLVPTIPKVRDHAPLAGRRSVQVDPPSLANYDAVLVATDHDEVDYVSIARHARLVVDTRNACARAGADLSHVVSA